jgi:hypothetical protein
LDIIRFAMSGIVLHFLPVLCCFDVVESFANLLFRLGQDFLKVFVLVSFQHRVDHGSPAGHVKQLVWAVPSGFVFGVVKNHLDVRKSCYPVRLVIPPSVGGVWTLMSKQLAGVATSGRNKKKTRSRDRITFLHA